jgi:sulfoxide reductase heme-binding subunit YedZ
MYSRLRRIRHHVGLGLAATGAYLVAWLSAPGETPADHVSIATAWLCLLLIAAALITGSVIRFRRGRGVLNNYLRRDIGIWAAVTGLVHFFVATDISMSQAYLGAYVNVPDAGLSADWRGRLFSWSTIAGLVIAIILLILLCISNNRMLARLGPLRWKRLQYLAYPALLLTAAHGVAFQLLEARAPLLIAVLIAMSGAAFGIRVFAGARRRDN